MTTEQLEQLRSLIEQWREKEHDRGEYCCDLTAERVCNNCADDLEEIVQTFNQDEES
jgi:hypothetical protein